MPKSGDTEPCGSTQRVLCMHKNVYWQIILRWIVINLYATFNPFVYTPQPTMIPVKSESPEKQNCHFYTICLLEYNTVHHVTINTRRIVTRINMRVWAQFEIVPIWFLCCITTIDYSTIGSWFFITACGRKNKIISVFVQDHRLRFLKIKG